MERDARIFVAGHRGLVGSAVLRRLRQGGYGNLLLASRQELDLRNQAAVEAWFRARCPDYVFLVAGTVGGIQANATRPAESTVRVESSGTQGGQPAWWVWIEGLRAVGELEVRRTFDD